MPPATTGQRTSKLMPRAIKSLVGSPAVIKRRTYYRGAPPHAAEDSRVAGKRSVTDNRVGTWRANRRR